LRSATPPLDLNRLVEHVVYLRPGWRLELDALVQPRIRHVAPGRHQEHRRAEREQIYVDMQKLWDEAVISVWVTNVPQIYVSKPEINPVVYPGGLCPMLREFK